MTGLLALPRDLGEEGYKIYHVFVTGVVGLLGIPRVSTRAWWGYRRSLRGGSYGGGGSYGEL